MFISVPKEIKNNENRVALTPAGVVSFVTEGHTVLVEKDAGIGSGFTNEDYTFAGAEIIDGAAIVWSKA
ncbi:MAG: alanine dehydrogenase, partial [Bacillus sp. (in: Bacteria)]|nr:alanine dehydrogenase [Bacillus sp. (in: firmicutes)]